MDHCISDVCLQQRKVFVCEQELYTPSQLRHHMIYGPADSIDPSHGALINVFSDAHAAVGHPRCEFCNEHYLDNDELFKHMSMSHHTCHLCERSGVLHQYYRDYEQLVCNGYCCVLI